MRTTAYERNGYALCFLSSSSLVCPVMLSCCGLRGLSFKTFEPKSASRFERISFSFILLTSYILTKQEQDISTTDKTFLQHSSAARIDHIFAGSMSTLASDLG